MTGWILRNTTALAAVLAGQAAFAQITPEEVWQNWQDMSATYGQTMTATSATRDGAALVVSGLAITQDQDGVAVDMRIDTVNFTDNGDGTVVITMSDAYAIDLTLPPDDGEGDTPTDLTISVAHPGMVTTVSGTATDTAYAVEAPSISVKLDSIAGVQASAVDAEAQATLSTVSGRYMVSGPVDAKLTDVEFGVQSVALNLLGRDDETQSDFQMTGTLSDLLVTYALDLAGISLMDGDLAQALRAGTSLVGNVRHGALDVSVDVTDPAGPTRIVTTSTGGGVNFAMDAAGLVYGITGTGTQIAISGPEIPFPEFNLAYGEIAMNLVMPLLAAPDLADFAFLTRIVDFSVSEDLWGMIDPAGSLPHDPATLIVDVKGKARLTADLVDEAAMAALGESAPGELHALDLTELRVSAVGAEMTGAGALTFDNTDLATFDGLPAPTGQIDLKVLGGNLLLDKLVGMGLLTADDANGARIMMSMFANAGPGEDELNSTLEFRDKGFYANGQRLQ